MWALVVLLYVQTNLDVDIVNIRIDSYYSESTCGGRESPETKTLPLEVGNAARWQYALCIRVRS